MTIVYIESAEFQYSYTIQMEIIFNQEMKNICSAIYLEIVGKNVFLRLLLNL